MQPRPNVAFCPVCRTPKAPNEVACRQCGTRSCPNGHVIDARICRQCGFEDRTWKPQQAKSPSLESTIIRTPGIPEVSEKICPRCHVKSLFTYGRCHNCGYILESKKSGAPMEADMAAPMPERQLAPDGTQHYVVQQQYPGTHDAKLVYICPRCGAKADPRTGSCYNCGYIGSLAYEMPKQQPPTETPPPPSPAKSFVRPPGSTAQQFSHPPEPTRACPSCGAAIPADSRFCRQCGFRSSGSTRQAGSQVSITGAAERVRSNPPPPSATGQTAPVTPVMSQMTPSIQTMPSSGGGLVQDLMGTYPQTTEMPYPGIEQPEKKARKKEKKEKPYPEERKRFPMGLLIAVFVVAAALVAMVMFTVSQILAPAPTPTTPVVDKTPPQISEVAVTSVTTSSITIEWMTDEKATSQIMICDPAGVCAYTEPNASLTTAHIMVLDSEKLNIQLNTEYHLTIKSMDAAGNEASYETDQTFTMGSQTPQPANVPEGIEVGNLAYDFTLKNLQDADVTLRSHLGKKVIMNFWATSCGPCCAELPYFEEIYKAQSSELEILAIDEWETKETVQSFIESNNYTFTVLLDTQGTVRSIYNILQVPRTYFIDSTGVIRNKKDGSFGDQAEIESILNTMQ